MNTKLFPWYVARSIRAAFSPVLMAVTWQRDFFETWGSVYRPPGA